MILKCQMCKHKPVCAMQRDMEKLKDELEDNRERMEYKHFRISVECEHYYNENTPKF